MLHRGLEMSVIAATAERSTGRVEDQGLLFEYTIKLVLFVGFLRTRSLSAGFPPWHAYQQDRGTA